MEAKGKKRGRKPKNEYYLTKKVDKVDIDKALIISLPINIESSCNDISEININTYNDVQPYESSTSMYKYAYNNGDNLITSIDTPILDLAEKTYYSLNVIPKNIHVNDISSKMKTDIYCYWCCHQFDTQPVFMPYNLKKDLFIVKGIFCSFECCLSYMSVSSRYCKHIHLLKYMYYVYTGKKFFRETLVKAPDRECLKIFGGPLSIEQFRNGLEKYEVLAHPMCYVSGLVEKTYAKPKDAKVENFLNEFIKKI